MHLSGSPPHGFVDDEASRALLRSRPPDAALSWVAAELGRAVVGVEPLLGGTSSAVHAVALSDGTRVVLRRYVRPQVLLEEPDIAAREARALEQVRCLALPTPGLLALDADGERSDVPALVTTHLPGRVDWAPADLDGWLRSLARLLPPVHAAAVPKGMLPQCFSYRQESYEPPPWATRPRLWRAAVEVFHRPAPPGSAVLVHRDFHPGNVLWEGGDVSALLDWQSASIGLPDVDVGHCRANLVRRFGLAVADRFAAMWEAEAGRRYDRWADVAAVVGMLDELREVVPSNAAQIEEQLARAV
jgi:aminoglycoside phosphotransferase (APT) family kinase protein